MAPYPAAIERFPKLRQSLLAAFDACALGAKFEQEHAYLPEEFMVDEDGGRTDWSWHHQGRGQLAHRTFARCLQTMAQAQEDRIEVDVALAILMDVLRQADVPDDEVVSVPMEQVADLYWVVKKWAYDNTFSIANLVSVEERLHSTVKYPDPEGGYVERVITGQIDALLVHPNNAHAVVLDWKDTWKLPAASEVGHDGYFQQRFYALLVMDTYPSINQVTLREFYVRYSEVREATVYRADLDDVRDEITALVERFDRAFQNDSHKPSPGQHCGWCLNPTGCPIFPKARGEGSIASAEEAKKVAAQLIVAQATSKKLMGALKAWADVHGDVPVKDAKEPNRVYGYRRSKRVDRPTPEATAAFLRGRLLDPARGEVDEKAVEEGVKTLYQEKVGTRFESFVPKPEVESDDEILEKLRLSVQQANKRVRDQE